MRSKLKTISKVSRTSFCLYLCSRENAKLSVRAFAHFDDKKYAMYVGSKKHTFSLYRRVKLTKKQTVLVSDLPVNSRLG